MKVTDYFPSSIIFLLISQTLCVKAAPSLASLESTEVLWDGPNEITVTLI